MVDDLDRAFGMLPQASPGGEFESFGLNTSRSVRSTMPAAAPVDEHRHDLRQAHGHGQGRHLDHEIFGIAIDHQPAESVAFAEDHSRGPWGWS